jgi:hypothetical protein
MAKQKRYLEGIVYVLERSKEPMRVAEIAKEIIKRKLVVPKGKTPENTVYSIIHQENLSRKKKGLKLLFKRVAPGLYKLNE